jgi:pimeloyl-ACP methyl ester carboxylesterase
VTARLDAERYRPLAVDLRGHGATRDARPIGFVECSADVLATAPERFVLCGYSMGGRIAQHVALAAPDRATVDAFHAAALEVGGTDNGEPGLREHYHPTYYGAYVLDPDGNNIEAVTHKPE